MFRPLTPSHRRAPRRGTVVVITIFALITILMVLGLAFMMYAVKEKAVAQAYKEAANTSGTAAPDPTNTINRFLGALVYDENDDGDSLHNALRGHSIARAMYGGRRDTSSPWAGSTVPWAGVGIFHEDAGNYAHATGTYPSLVALPQTPQNLRDRAQFVNHTVMTVDGKALVIDPEWTGNRFADNTNALTPFNASQGLAGRNYVGQHAGYTYPDLKNFFLGARDPATGEVLMQSFFREWLFRHTSQPAGQSALHPNNPNWTNATGRLLTLRPRPAEHPNFPRVPPNAPDPMTNAVTYTGDVQNLPGAVGVQKNDSLWMHIGLKPITLADGRIVQPMVAPLIVPADGLFDLSMHGNRLGTGGAHVSYGGYAPWEINPIYGVTNDAERQAIMQYRNPSRQAAFDPFTSSRLLPAYSSVAWTGQNPVTFMLPTNGNIRGLPSSGDPSAAPAYGSFQNDNAPIAHPAGYNPNEFTVMSDTNPTSPVYPYTDIKRLSLRYAFTPDWYFQAFVSKPGGAQTTFFGNPGMYPYIPNPGATTLPPTGQQAYRLDPAHRNRLLFSPKNSSLDRPAIAPTFSRLVTEAFQILPGATKPGSLFTTATPPLYPSPTSRGANTDFAADNQWVNAYAALGSVNLNRPLADYRDLTLPSNNPPKALSATNIGNLAQAEADRQQFAKDIFARLVAALGAAATIDTTTGNVTIPAAVTPGSPQYDALRYLAQVAVNIVDHIDNDDISTVFVWNPSNTLNPPAGLATDLSAAEVGNRVVFGVEKPRLVINEAYSEIVNDDADPVDGPMVGGVQQKPTKPANVRFWLELLNPTSTLSTVPSVGPLGTGSVPLTAYAVQIRRETRKTITPAANQDTLAAAKPGQNQYPYLFSNLTNVAGAFDLSKGIPDTTCEFSKILPTAPGPLTPNDAQYSQPNLPAQGIVLIGPPAPDKAGSDQFAPTGGVWTGMIQSPALQPAATTPATGTGGMGYTFELPDANTKFSDMEFKRHIVLLRRAANPYLTPNDPIIGAAAGTLNPYVTVDVMDYVPSFDGVNRGKDDGASRKVRPMGTAGYDPVGERFSIGKVQPLAGYSAAEQYMNGEAKYNSYLFQNSVNPTQSSMVLRQVATAGQVQHTFGRHNGSTTNPPGGTTISNPGAALATMLPNTETIMAPFDWLPHADRPLETLGDVFFARDSKPHMLTNEFVRNTTNGLVYDGGYGRWQFHETGLARALELLTVKSPSSYVAHGGRVGGKINVNAMQDRRIALGLWDAPATVTTGNRFDTTFVNRIVWGDLTLSPPVPSWMNSRTPLQTRNTASGAAADQVFVPAPNQKPDGTPAPSFTDTVTGNGSDRPFLPFGAPSATAGSFAYGPGSGIGDTILRYGPAVGTNPALPFLYQTAETNLYTQSEPFRKVVNNVTTVSHTFVVYLTIGYFDVTFPTTAGWPTGVSQPPQFGAEVYDKIPGDMRQKYVAFVDMSNMALRAQFTPAAAPTTADPEPTNPQSIVRPFFTALDKTTYFPPSSGLPVLSVSYSTDGTNWYIMADGEKISIVPQMILVLGYGAEQQIVKVENILGPGQLEVSGMAKTAWGGTCVSNVRPGYAGPQSSFDYTLPKYKPVVPYVERLR